MRGSLLVEVATISECLQFIIEHSVKFNTVEEVEKRIGLIMSALPKLPMPSTLAVAKELDDFRQRVFRDLQRAAPVGGQLETELITIAKTVKRAFLTEAESRAVAFANETAVAEALRKVPAAFPYLTAEQHFLREEVERCLEVENYRSAIVMGWSFAYDFVRRWVYSNRLGDFNAALQAGFQRNNKPIYDPIGKYEVFWEMKPLPGD